MARFFKIAAPLSALLLFLGVAVGSAASFVNFETAPIHPVAVSPSGKTLVVCNLPDGRLEVFKLDSDPPAHVGSVFTGIDPVSVRFLDENTVWVVNEISDTVSVVQIAEMQVAKTLATADAPADVVFAGTPKLAFVSCSGTHEVQIFSVSSGALLQTVSVQGQKPKALAVSPDGKRVYAAIFESGNASTIIAPPATMLGRFPPASPVDFEEGPHGGLNPPPNAVAGFNPPLNPKLPAGSVPPRVSLIVKKNRAGRWMDDTEADWTEFVTGTNAVYTDRKIGWDLPDHDIAVLDLAAGSVSHINGLMNICMDLAVNPVSGRIAMVGTDGLNHIRFEPVLQGKFIRVELALVNPADPGANQIKDINSHLDYTVPTIPQSRRDLSLGDPRAVLWHPNGKALYIAGMGSNNLLKMDSEGNRVGVPIAVGEGPVGLAADSAGSRLYVYNRFGASVSVVDTAAFKVVRTLPLHDPSPAAIKIGRKHFYDTHKTSGLGQAACASCHLDGRMDRLAWDLGTPAGEMKLLNSTNRNFATAFPTNVSHFHPMKGPMVTQTLQDIVGHEPFHWRGDRDGIEEFNATFKDLQGDDAELTDAEMQEFEDFLATIQLPPNRFRNFDNSLPTNLPIPGHLSLGRGDRFRGDQLPPGNAVRGLNAFLSNGAQGCVTCHTLPTGLGADMIFSQNQWRPIAVGPKGEHHAAMKSLERSSDLPFKVAQLRTLPDKVGLDFSDTSSPAGFGFMHDGRVDTLTRFVQDGFDINDDQTTSDLIAFLLAFGGSDLPDGTLVNPDRAPGLKGQDAAAAVGKQLTLAAGNLTLLTPFLNLAKIQASRVDLVAKGFKDGIPRGWVFDRATGFFKSDRQTETATPQTLVALATAAHPLTFTVVPRDSGERLGIDRDGDGVPDQTEREKGADPADPNSYPGHIDIRIGSVALLKDGVEFSWNTQSGKNYQAQSRAEFGGAGWVNEGDPISAPGLSLKTTLRLKPGQAYYRVIQLP